MPSLGFGTISLGVTGVLVEGRWSYSAEVQTADKKKASSLPIKVTDRKLRKRIQVVTVDVSGVGGIALVEAVGTEQTCTFSRPGFNKSITGTLMSAACDFQNGTVAKTRYVIKGYGD